MHFNANQKEFKMNHFKHGKCFVIYWHALGLGYDLSHNTEVHTKPIHHT